MVALIPVSAGGRVDEAGAYAMSMGTYHSQCCAGPSISSSGLRTIYNESPARFWAFSDLNPDRFPKEDKKTFDFGRAAHALLLGDEVFEDGFMVAPKDAPQRPTEAMLNAKKPSPASVERVAFWASIDAVAAGRTIISGEEHQTIAHMAESLNWHPAISHYRLFDGTPEASLVWPYEKAWIKSRPDMLPASGQEIADLKTTASADRRFCDRAITNHGYDMQMALAIDGAKIVLGLEIKEAVLVFVEKEPPFMVRVVPLGLDALEYARRKNRIAMKAFAKAIASGEWPLPADDMHPWHTPQWMVDDLNLRASEDD